MEIASWPLSSGVGRCLILGGGGANFLGDIILVYIHAKMPVCCLLFYYFVQSTIEISEVKICA